MIQTTIMMHFYIVGEGIQGQFFGNMFLCSIQLV